MVNKALQVKLGNWTLDNPIIPASGTFGFGFDHAKYYDLNILGSISFKGTTLNASEGNPNPRICEVSQGMINAIGLQNPGVDHIKKYELVQLKSIFHKKVIANIAATDIDSYVQIVQKLNDEIIIGIYEINVSCPNVNKGCLKFDSDPQALTALVKAIKKVAKKPIYVKLSPQVTDIVLMAKTAEQAGADGLVLINTMPGMRIDINTRKPILGNKIGGMSGPALKPIALRAIYLCSQNVKIPIIGSGGVSSPEDVIEMMCAGATAIQVGSANLVDPYACFKIIQALPQLMHKLKINKLVDIIGKAWK
ncbi:MAG: dihydroorotate dehydrogenase [Mycoplasmataceae bacterium]|nr:dihydroorotate dehydrogenase [Mycoplasmataceae bacterium]